MKKYLQITIVLGAFFVLVFLRNIKGSNDSSPVVSAPIIATPTPSFSSSKQATPTISTAGQYKDGIYTGSIADAYYGNIQVQVLISNGKLYDVVFLQYPSDNQTSESINTQAMPLLKEEALQKQSASVDVISGASYSSQAFIQSLGDALAQAK